MPTRLGDSKKRNLRARVNRLAITLLAGVAGFVLLVAGTFLAFVYFTSPPRETKLLADFYANRAAFEKLRDMLQEDEQIHRLGAFGVYTVKNGTPGLSKPPEGDFPLERFQQYLTLLKQAHALGVLRNDDLYPYLSILVWRTGFAGNSEHIWVCWTENAVSEKVSNFDDHSSNGSVFRHIDSNWYLRKGPLPRADP